MEATSSRVLQKRDLHLAHKLTTLTLNETVGVIFTVVTDDARFNLHEIQIKARTMPRSQNTFFFAVLKFNS